MVGRSFSGRSQVAHAGCRAPGRIGRGEDRSEETRIDRAAARLATGQGARTAAHRPRVARRRGRAAQAQRPQLQGPQCPFHEEKTPSFHVHPESQIFRCYGCGEGGDLFAFVMKREGIGFREALEELAERAGGRPARGGGGARGPAKQQCPRGPGRAQAFFAARLRAPRAPRPCTARYVEGRGLEAALVPFGLGHAPGPSEAPGGGRHWPLVAELGRRRAAPLAAELGLVGRTERGQWYDRFRNRLTFPIHDGQGRIVGFGGRILPGHEGEREPKYLNIGAGVQQAQPPVRAGQGAPGPGPAAGRHGGLHRRHRLPPRRHPRGGRDAGHEPDPRARRADPALRPGRNRAAVRRRRGRPAGRRAGYGPPCRPRPCCSRICLLEGGKDPADWPGPRVARSIERVLDGARDALEVWIELLSARHDPSRHEGKVAVAEACREVLRELGDPWSARTWPGAARLLFVAPDRLLAGVRNRRPARAPEAGRRPGPAPRVGSEAILEALLRDPAQLEALEELWPDEDLRFADPVASELLAGLQAWVVEHGHHPTPADLVRLWVDHVTEDAERLRWLMGLEEASRALSEPRQALVDGVMFLRNHRSQNEIRQLRETIARTRRDGGPDRARELEKQLSRLMKSAAQGGPAP
ncbi:MAG: CHC2 zinc finger domain-containing protein [Planctomycetota bacterium]